MRITSGSGDSEGITDSYNNAREAEKTAGNDSVKSDNQEDISERQTDEWLAYNRLSQEIMYLSTRIEPTTEEDVAELNRLLTEVDALGPARYIDSTLVGNIKAQRESMGLLDRVTLESLQTWQRLQRNHSVSELGYIAFDGTKYVVMGVEEFAMTMADAANKIQKANTAKTSDLADRITSSENSIKGLKEIKDVTLGKRYVPTDADLEADYQDQLKYYNDVTLVQYNKDLKTYNDNKADYIEHNTFFTKGELDNLLSRNEHNKLGSVLRDAIKKGLSYTPENSGAILKKIRDYCNNTIALTMTDKEMYDELKTVAPNTNIGTWDDFDNGRNPAGLALALRVIPDVETSNKMRFNPNPPPVPPKPTKISGIDIKFDARIDANTPGKILSYNDGLKSEIKTLQDKMAGLQNEREQLTKSANPDQDEITTLEQDMNSVQSTIDGVQKIVSRIDEAFAGVDKNNPQAMNAATKKLALDEDFATQLSDSMVAVTDFSKKAQDSLSMSMKDLSERLGLIKAMMDKFDEMYKNTTQKLGRG